MNARAQQARERNKRTGDKTMLDYVDNDDNDDYHNDNCGNG